MGMGISVTLKVSTEKGAVGVLEDDAITFLHFSHTFNSFSRQSGDL